MIEGLDERYVATFIRRFKEKIIKEEGEILEKLKDYEDFAGNYIVSFSNKNKGNSTIKRTKKFDPKIEKAVGGIYLPDTFKDFLKYHKSKQVPIEIGEGRDAITGIISVKERRLGKEYRLKGDILDQLRGAYLNDMSLEEYFNSVKSL